MNKELRVIGSLEPKVNCTKLNEGNSFEHNLQFSLTIGEDQD